MVSVVRSSGSHDIDGVNRIAVRSGVPVLRAGGEAGRGQPVQELPGLVQRAAEIAGAAYVAEGAAFEGQHVDGIRHRQLRGEVDDAARARLAIQHRGRSLQYVDALEQVGIDLLGGVEGAVEQLELVEELVDAVDRVEAAYADLVVARREAAILAGDARGVAQRLAKRARVLLVELCAGHHRDRLGRVDQRRVGLGGGVGILWHEAVAPVAMTDHRDDLGRLLAAFGAKLPRRRLDCDRCSRLRPGRLRREQAAGQAGGRREHEGVTQRPPQPWAHSAISLGWGRALVRARGGSRPAVAEPAPPGQEAGHREAGGREAEQQDQQACRQAEDLAAMQRVERAKHQPPRAIQPRLVRSRRRRHCDGRSSR